MRQPRLELLEGGAPRLEPGGLAVDFVLPAVRPGEQRLPFDEAAATVPFEDALPVRAFPAYRGQRNYPGWWWAATNRRHVGYESWLERQHLVMLDFDPTVKGVSSQPFLLHGRDHDGSEWRHTPDYFCRLAGGGGRVVNVKTGHAARRPRFKAQERRVEDACRQAGWEYATVTEPDPVRSANVMWLAGYRRPLPQQQAALADAVVAACTAPTPVRDLAEAVDDPVVTLPVVFHLCWHLRLALDISAELTSATLVHPGAAA